MDPWDINPNYRLAIWKELLAELRKYRATRKAARTKNNAEADCCSA